MDARRGNAKGTSSQAEGASPPPAGPAPARRAAVEGAVMTCSTRPLSRSSNGCNPANWGLRDESSMACAANVSACRSRASNRYDANALVSPSGT
eukprot:7814263-Pyramimonas_sp.AAC.1